MELVIMAAGMGSRFGGLKQIEPVDDDGNFIIDYSIFDAIKCGFDKVIFIIKKENLEIFRTTIGKRIEKHIKTEYAFQELKTEKEIDIPNSRTKPLGTGHAIYSARNLITSNFAVINADDYYGFDAILAISNFLKYNTSANNYALVGYEAINTMCGDASVKRGICKIENNNLQQITESLIEKENNKLYASPLEKDYDKHQIDNHQIVSMNLFGFTKEFLTHLDIAFEQFLENNKANLETCEFFLPTVVSDLILNKKATVTVLNTNSKWHGITYKEDKDKVVSFLKSQKNAGIYPQHLWN